VDIRAEGAASGEEEELFPLRERLLRDDDTRHFHGFSHAGQPPPHRGVHLHEGRRVKRMNGVERA